MILSDLHAGTTQTIDRVAWFSHPAISPDGTALAYVRNNEPNQPPTGLELVIYDITRGTQTVIAVQPYDSSWYSQPSGFEETFWSQDGQRLFLKTFSAQTPPTPTPVATSTNGGVLLVPIRAKVSLLERDGTQISYAALPESGRVIGVTSDDQLILSYSDYTRVSWLPLRPGSAPYSPDVTSPGGWFRLVSPQ